MKKLLMPFLSTC